MDTLDYSTPDIPQGSKVVMAAAGKKKRALTHEFSPTFSLPEAFFYPKIVAPGMVVVEGPAFKTYPTAKIQINRLKKHLQTQPGLASLPLFVVVDDADFAATSFSNFLWVTFLRSNPSHDIYGVNEKIRFKHWECAPPLIIDARIKPFHTDPLVSDPKVIETVKALGKKGGPLFGII